MSKLEDTISLNLKKLTQMESIEIINMKDLDQIEAVMSQISLIQKEASDAIQIVYDEQATLQKSLILNGGLGWKIDTEATY